MNKKKPSKNNILQNDSLNKTLYTERLLKISGKISEDLRLNVINQEIYKQTIEGIIRKIRIAIYVRVSTEEQAKSGYSIDAQLDKLINLAFLKVSWYSKLVTP